MTDKPTPKEMDDLFVEETGFDPDDFPAAIFGFVRAVLAKWGTPQPSPAEPPAPRGEPVAWLNPWRADQVTTDYDAYGRRGIPLYTAPQPVAREPLTDEQIDRAIAELGLNYLADAHATNRAVLRKLCRHAHGIKGGQHDAG